MKIKDERRGLIQTYYESLIRQCVAEGVCSSQ